jgi:hypothetical protein
MSRPASQVAAPQLPGQADAAGPSGGARCGACMESANLLLSVAPCSARPRACKGRGPTVGLGARQGPILDFTLSIQLPTFPPRLSTIPHVVIAPVPSASLPLLYGQCSSPDSLPRIIDTPDSPHSVGFWFARIRLFALFDPDARPHSHSRSHPHPTWLTKPLTKPLSPVTMALTRRVTT